MNAGTSTPEKGGEREEEEDSSSLMALPVNNQDQTMTCENIYYALVVIAEEYPRNNAMIVHSDFTSAINLKFIIRRVKPPLVRALAPACTLRCYNGEAYLTASTGEGGVIVSDAERTKRFCSEIDLATGLVACFVGDLFVRNEAFCFEVVANSVPPSRSIGSFARTSQVTSLDLAGRTSQVTRGECNAVSEASIFRS
ncbi:hypothetical protein K0M31_011385 [Melipona bicolor]|uniref:Uncharacterized protein n=1 Tax=Melipona bicolor TaxID=60889 RepID=A0AA40G9G7_9HYME|nr:hypothetical protein K0M31_011385 [Melipona bicolor]